METPRGMRDFPPEEKIRRDRILARLRSVFERYGFSPLGTPIAERWEVLSAKYAGGEDILKETFKFKDQGGRDLGLRYDLTVPLARFISQNTNVKLPFKRYQVERVYRDGPVKLGRYREFYQCDCDIVGADSALADAQCVQLALAVFKELELDVTLYVNDVSLLRGMLDLPEEKKTQAMLILDKLRKQGETSVRKELEEAGIDPKVIDPVLDAAKLKNDEKVKKLKAERIGDVLKIVNDDRVVFDPSMSRGLSYYTGVVFEAYLKEGDVKSSLCGGGRYDDMISQFTGKDKYPAVGISFGLEPIMDSLPKEERKSVTEAFVIPIKTEERSTQLVNELREAGLNADMDLMGRGVSKNLTYADQLGIPKVVIVGERDLKENSCTVKDMASGDETKVKISDLAKELS